jgi:hypothetical protein
MSIMAYCAWLKSCYFQHRERGIKIRDEFWRAVIKSASSGPKRDDEHAHGNFTVSLSLGPKIPLAFLRR